MRSWWNTRTAWEKTAFAVWGAILLFVCVRSYYWPEDKTVYPIFSASGRFWWTGTDLYEPDRPKGAPDGYRYSPTVTILFTPFAVFPDDVGGVLWRLFSAAALLGSFVWLARAVLFSGEPSPVRGRVAQTAAQPGPLRGSARQLRDHFAWFMLGCVPLSLQSLNNGQTNLVVIAAMLTAVVAVKEERWNLAALAMALAFDVKLYPLALGLLLILCYPRQLLWRIPLFCAGSLLVPFLFQHPSYVIDQYGKWITILREEDRSAISLDHMYRDLWLLIHIYDLPISRDVYKLIQIGAGIGVAVLTWHRQRAGWPERPLLISTLGLAVAWMMLLGPAPESSSFILLAPSLAWSVLEAMHTNSLRRLLLWGSVAFFLVAVVLGGFSQTVKVHTLGVHSWGSLLYFVYLLTEPKPAACGLALEPRLANTTSQAA